MAILSKIVFEDIELDEIGKINVLCGRNNSGKSYLLSNVFKQKDKADDSTFQYSLSKEDIKRITEYIETDLKSVSLKGIIEIDIDFYVAEELLRVLNTKISERTWSLLDKTLFYDYCKQSLNEPRVNILAKVQDSFFKHIQEYHLRTQFIQVDSRSIRFSQKSSEREPNVNGTGIPPVLLHWQQPTYENKEVKKYYDEFIFWFEYITKNQSLYINPLSDNTQISVINYGKATPIDKCGKGLQDLIVILFFAIHPDYPILLIDEPETHLHADAQRRLLEALASIKHKNIFIATHSPHFLNSCYIDNLYLMQNKDSITATNILSKEQVLEELGENAIDYLDFDLLVITEGVTDEYFISTWLNTLNMNKLYTIKYLHVNGNQMDSFDLSIFNGTNRVALIDREGIHSQTNKKREDFEKRCSETNIYCHRLKRYAIENYLPPHIVYEVCPQVKHKPEYFLHDKKLEEQIGIDIKGRENPTKIAKMMTVEQINQMDDLSNFLNHIIELSTNAPTT